jgi:hypothetical protein
VDNEVFEVVKVLNSDKAPDPDGLLWVFHARSTFEKPQCHLHFSYFEETKGS